MYEDNADNETNIEKKLNVLGKQVRYQDIYNPRLLEAIPRHSGRSILALDENDLPFFGTDIWNLYELSWLSSLGKPVVAMGSIYIPATSSNMIESKSLKLYLNSFNQTVFKTLEEVSGTLESDLSITACAPVKVSLEIYTGKLPNEQSELRWSELEATHCLDNLEVTIEEYRVNPKLLKHKLIEPEPDSENTQLVGESWWMHGFKSNCPVTYQPDWASIFIRYEGQAIQPESLYQYLVSYRKESEFHEHCVERIFQDIMRELEPIHLSVYARYLRRGGIDINPFRSNFETDFENQRLFRQ